MKKKIVVLMLSAAMTMSMMTGCGNTAKDDSASTTTETTQDAEATEEAEPTEEATEEATDDSASDQEAADKVAALIDQIYVQERNDNTDEQCKEAKEAWDALTDAQKELVEGENADPDYFGRDTGDASKDDPLNGDDIGDNELLVVSFGTSFNDSRTADIGGIEKALQTAYPDWSVRRAFTAQIIINHVQARDDEKIDNMDQALQRAVDNGVKNLVVQPTHLMHGAEYDELTEAVESYKDKFESVSIAEPLLGEVGDSDDAVNDDKKAVAEAITTEAVKTAGYDDLDAAEADGTAFVFMGHGTSHTAKISYSQMQSQMNDLGYKNVFIGTVEGEPEDTACEAVIEKIKEAGYKKVVLRPLMVVAGDHANNDMAGDDEDSWKSQFEASGAFDKIDTQIAGLGEIAAIQDLYVAHTKAAMDGNDAAVSEESEETSGALEDGTYEAEFDTDSGMFHVNEANDGKGILTVKDGKMTIHISLVSKNIVNLYVGKAADAQKDGAELLQPTTDTITYDDGSTEEVYGFDVPVKALDETFDLALVGTKGKWYDHEVSVSDPVKAE
ncbi:sirohydrochlorin cobaltochelatase [Blautia producta]|nr:sirohydrochlorin cobaltochelatase [Blautia producta]